MINYSVDADGLATITWDMPDRSQNVLSKESLPRFFELVKQAIADTNVKGVVVTSSKADFVAGADLAMIQDLTTAEQIEQSCFDIHAGLRAIEKGGKPFVAALNGTTLGGGYEVALACHRRIAADVPKAQIGLPEVMLGLLPGGGGTQRLPRMIGVRASLPYLLEGKKLAPDAAKEAGLVDEVVPANELLARAKAWALGEGQKATTKPWDQKGFKLPDPVQSPKGYETFTAGNAMLREKTFGNMPAPRHILSCVYEGCQVDLDTGLRIEARYFAACVLSPESRNMVRTLFFAIGDANKLASRPKDVPKQAFTKVGILGAGMMGAGIAWSTASAGIDVVLLDSTIEKAEKGKAYSKGLSDKAVSRGKMSHADQELLLARIKATTSYDDLRGCELVVEAVFEDRGIKASVTKEAEARLEAGAVFASNTSTLPITGLAQASVRPDHFIGLHFFSPVDKMPLVEIIRGKQTSDACLAKAMDYVKKIRKTPVVVNDSRGFYTSRVFATYVNEGLSMLAEGVAPALVENAGRMAGMPVGPLALADEVSLELMYSVRRQTQADLGADYRGTPGDEVTRKMVEDEKRVGRKAQAGFCDYPADGSKKRLWKGLATLFPVAARQPDVSALIDRFLYIQSIESARCLQEGVVLTAADADVGSILGWGFAPHAGGTISHIHTVGVAAFVERAQALAKAHGERFAPPKLLRDMAAKGATFYER